MTFMSRDFMTHAISVRLIPHPVTACLLCAILLATTPLVAEEADDVLPGTEALTLEGDIASQLVDGVDRFLLRELAASIEKRPAHWNRDVTSAEAYAESVQSNRARLATILGLRDPRVPFSALELRATTQRGSLVARTDRYAIHEVRWPVIGDVFSEGLLLEPTGTIRAQIVAIPDADQTPEQLAGLADGIPESAQFARRLAENGCRVVVPALISREREKRNGRANLTHREYLHRSAFELGRMLIGYEIQKVQSCIDWFEASLKPAAGAVASPPIGVMGYGEGGLIALSAAAVDRRITSACVSGYFGSRQRVWEEPLEHNVFGLLEQFGDAELATLVFPRTLVIEPARGPELQLSGEGGAPAQLVSPQPGEVRAEYARAVALVPGLRLSRTSGVTPIAEADSFAPVGSDASLQRLLAGLGITSELEPPQARPAALRDLPDPQARLQRLIHQLDRHNQWLLRESPFVRKEFLQKQDTSSLDAFVASNEWYRDYFREEVVGHFDTPLLPANPRSRKIDENEKWSRYEVVLNVFPDVMAYGILTIPRDIARGERRPVVVCQHGLEGRPQSVIGELQYNAYKAFATQLAERGFITFAPQNLYIFTDRFRTLQRKANPLKKTLFSIIVPQHQQIVDWLQEQPFVDPERIAFYGLSYGGKSAMRIPPLVQDYCLSICSADFNEWVRKNASTRHHFSYVWTGEYEIFEFDLGSTFNYAEMASLIAPRPFMVERGHFDGVGTDEWVAYEFAKVRHLYAAKLGLADRCEIEWFVGPHTINGQGTFAFLHRHLDWPEPE